MSAAFPRRRSVTSSWPDGDRTRFGSNLFVFVDTLFPDWMRRVLWPALPARYLRRFDEPGLRQVPVYDDVVPVKTLEQRFPQIASAVIPPLVSRILEIDREPDHLLVSQR